MPTFNINLPDIGGSFNPGDGAAGYIYDGEGRNVLGPLTSAPEIDPTSAASGLTLLLGGLVALRGRRPRNCIVA